MKIVTSGEEAHGDLVLLEFIIVASRCPAQQFVLSNAFKK